MQRTLTYGNFPAMHSSFTSFNANVRRAPNQSLNQYQHQIGGQPIYNIGVPATYGSILMSHPPNLFMNQPFTRSFASVVSCDNHLGKRQHVNNSNIITSKQSTTNHHQTNSTNSGGFFGQILKHFTAASSASEQHCQTTTLPLHKEFEDYKQMPSMAKEEQHCGNNNNFHHTSNFDIKMPIISPSPQKSSPSVANQMNHLQSGLCLMSSLFRTKPTTSQSKTSRWFGGRSKKRQVKNNCSKLHNHAVTLQKNAQEKERSSIERDIMEEYCDIDTPLDVMNQYDRDSTMKTTEPAAHDKISSDTILDKDQPSSFEIFSLEEFPAIVKDCASLSLPSSFVLNIKKSPTASPTTKRQEMDHYESEEGFVILAQADSTPSFVPKRITLCEKMSHILKSPQKMMTPRKSCLKPQRTRNISECSDDFIVFDSSACEADETMSDICDQDDDSSDDENDVEIESKTECETDDDEMDLTMCQNVTMSESEDEERPELQLDSGVEERKVKFLCDSIYFYSVFIYLHMSPFYNFFLGSLQYDPKNTCDACMELCLSRGT